MSQIDSDNSDAVLGGQNPHFLNSAILGGLAGIKQRLESGLPVAKLQALKDVIQYGADGISLSLQALSDPNEDVRRLARRLLRNQYGEEGKAAFLEQEPSSYLITIANWRYEIYNPEVGIRDPENNAYAIRLTTSRNQSQQNVYHASQYVCDIVQFESLIKDPRVCELEALIIQIDILNSWYTFGIALDEIINAQHLFPNLRGLFVGDSTDEIPEYYQSGLPVFDIKPFLEAFPDLEILQIHGNFAEYTLECAEVKHQNLKTLIIETADISEENIRQIIAMDLPNLEYFKMWIGSWQHCLSHSEIARFHEFPDHIGSYHDKHKKIYRYSVSNEYDA
jgi:hypothetical protein